MQQNTAIRIQRRLNISCSCSSWQKTTASGWGRSLFCAMYSSPCPALERTRQPQARLAGARATQLLGMLIPSSQPHLRHSPSSLIISTTSVTVSRNRTVGRLDWHMSRLHRRCRDPVVNLASLKAAPAMACFGLMAASHVTPREMPFPTPPSRFRLP